MKLQVMFFDENGEKIGPTIISEDFNRPLALLLANSPIPPGAREVDIDVL